MQKSKIPSPSRSQGAPITPRRGRPRRTRSAASPALSTASGRLTSVIEHFKENNMESFALSPLSSRRSVLTDNTDIEEPRHRSWWKNLKENTKDVMEVLEDNKAVEGNQALEELFEFEVLSPEKKDHTLDMPESSGSESIQSIVVPQRKLFTQKNHAQTKFSQFVITRESLAKKSNTSTHSNGTTLIAGTRQLFQGTKRTKPMFPASLLDVTPNETIVEKTKELAAEPKQIKNMFGNRPANKRKNMFANFIVTDSEEDIEEIQPKVFGFKKKADQLRGAEPPSSNITSDIDMDDWRHLPSSTMVEHQLEEIMRGHTPIKRARLENQEKETNKSRKNVSKRFANIQENIIDENVDESPKKVTRTLLEMLESSDDDIRDDEIKAGIIKQQDRNKDDAIDGPSTNNAENQELVEDPKVYEENEDEPASTSHETVDKNNANLENQEVNNESQDVKDGDENKNEASANKSLIGHQEPENEVSGDINHGSNLDDNDDAERNAEKIEDSDKNDEVERSGDVSQRVENEADENENDDNEHNIDYNDEIQENEISVNESQVEDNAEESDNENDQEMEDDNEEVNNESEENEVSVNQGVNESQVEDNAEESDNENDQEMEDDNEEVNNESEENEVSVNVSQVEDNAEESDNENDQEIEDDNESEENEVSVNVSQVEDNAEESDNENDPEIEDDNEEVNNESEENEVIVNESQVEDDAEESDNENNQQMEDDNEEVNNESEENEASVNVSQVEDNAEESDIENDAELEDMEEDHQELKYESDVEETGEQNGSIVEIEGTPNATHDTTGRNRKKASDKSPEVILHEKSNQEVSFTAQGNNTSIRKTLLKSLDIRPSMAPPRESTGVSSDEGSGWDSHRTTRKTMRQTFGKDFTIRKSLRTLVMEKSAKRQTEHVEIQSETVKLPQANSTELPNESGGDADGMAEEMVEESAHEVSIRTRRNILLTHIQRIKQENLEKRLKIREEILNRIKPPTRDPLNIFLEPSKPAPRRPKPSQNTKKQIKTITPFGNLPPEMIEDLKYKPPKRFAPASWTTKRLYKFLETKLEPRYDYKARVRAEKLVETIFNFVKGIRRHKTAPLDAVDALKHEMARLDIVKTHFEFYNFFHEFMPREVRIKVNPDIVNMIPLPRNGVFADILNTVH